MTSKGQDKKDLLSRVLEHPLSRRRFLESSGAATGAAVAAGTLLRPAKAKALNDTGIPDDVEISPGVDVRYSVCLGCHSKCGIRVRVKDDTVLKVDGNPWHPNCAETGERLDFATDLETAKTVRATCCPKGQAGVEVMYNPFRIKKPLKRVGARGSGQWEEISWDQALNEIAGILQPYYNGGPGGSSESHIPTVDRSISLGTIANQVAFSPGRFQHGQKEFTDRVFKGGFGTVNARHDHTSICETSHHVSGAFMTERFLPSQKDIKHHFKPEQENSQYILWFGTNPLEANFPGQTLAKRVALSRNAGTKHVIIDPRHSRACAFAHKWLAVAVGGDTALALGIAQRILEQGSHNVPALEAANYLAAQALTPQEFEASDATYLVVVSAPDPAGEQLFHRVDGAFQIVDKASGEVTALSRGSTADAQTGWIELDGTEAGAVAAADAGLDASVVGDFVIDLGDGRYAAPVFQLYKARVFSMSLDQYASACGIDADTIQGVADEFAAAAPACNANAYRGPCQHFNGVSAVQAVMALNALVMNYEHKGGTIGGTGGHLHEMGGKADGQLSLGSKYGSSKRSTSGPQITRVKSFFDSTMASALGESLDQATKRPWFPYAYNGNYQEIVPSIEDRYPYATKVLISLWNNLPYSSPASKDAAFRVLTDETKLPVHVCFDIEMSEMPSLADYILPDGSYFERWSTPHNSPVLLSVFSGFRSPVVGYYANKVGPNGKNYWDSLAAGELDQWNYTIDWASDTGPFTAEDIVIELMRRVVGGDLTDFAGLGDNAYYADENAMLADGVSASMRNALNTAWDWYWNMLVNFAIEAGVDPADSGAINDLVHEMVERGGWFQDTPGDRSNEYSGDYVKNKAKAANKGKAIHIFHEYANPDGERYVDPYSLRYYDPLPAVSPVLDAKGHAVDDGSEYPLDCVTYKPMYHSQGRTDSLPSLTMLEPENFVEINTADARRFGLWNGDLVKLSSASNTSGVQGRVKVTERIRPGVVAISHSRGRWEINSRRYRVNGTYTEADSRRGQGLASNPVMRLDPTLGNVTLQDPIGGSSSFSDTKVKVEKVSV